MTFYKCIKFGFQNVANFSGRSSRSEYNYWLLFLFIVQFYAIIIDPPSPEFINDSTNASNIGEVDAAAKNIIYDPLKSRLFSFVYFLLIIPSSSLVIRRFHDTGKSGWYILLPFTIIGILPYYYWTCIIPGEKKDNIYGVNPLNHDK